MANLVPYIGPAFLVAVGFMDPGSWASIIEGGSRFGYELMWVVLFSTILAMLLQTISARLGVITGKHFAQVCREEYPWAVCALLWVLCEISIITLDLTMVLGTAICLNITLQMPIFPSLMLMTVDSLLSILVLPLMEMKRTDVFAMVVVGIISLCFLPGSISSSALPLSMVTGLRPKLRHETLYTTISIVGANVVPHSLYLHSALAKDQDQGHQSLSTLSNYTFLGTLFAFSAVLVVNLSVLVTAVAGFHNAGLVVLTLHDAQALIEQILNSSISPGVCGLALICAGQLSALNGSAAGKVVLEAFLDYKIRPWQHRILIRGIALVLAATCVWRCGNEGTYQILVFSQVLLALHLPFTVAPLIKITSSERIMGCHRNSALVEILTWLSISIISAVNVTLVFDLVFGEGEEGASFGGFEYLAGFEWLIEIWGENLQTVVFAAISLGTSLSLGFLVWLIFTPLQMDTQLPARALWLEGYVKQEKADQQALGSRLAIRETSVGSLLSRVTAEMENEETLMKDISSVASLPNNNKAPCLSATEGVDENCLAELVKIQSVPQLLDLDNCEGHSSPSSTCMAVGSSFGLSSPESTASCSTIRKHCKVDVVSAAEDRESLALKKAEAEADADAELLGKDDDEIDAWDSLEPDDVRADAFVSNVNGSTSSLHHEGPESGRSFKSDTSEGGSGSGSLSRLSGLGRAARRQFALILDEFWTNIFDLHGKPLQPRLPSLLPGSGYCHMDGHVLSRLNSHEESDSLNTESKQSKLSWKKLNSTSGQVRDMAGYIRQTHAHAVGSTSSQLSVTRSQEYRVSPTYMSERRYSSMYMPSYHEEYDYQPATVHGYGTPSFSGRPGSCSASPKARPLHLGAPLFGSRSSHDHGHAGDSDSGSVLGEPLDTFKTGQRLLSPIWASNTVGARSSADTQCVDRFLSQTEKHLGASEPSSYDSSQWDPIVYQSRNSSIGRWNPLVYRATGELDMKNLGKPEELNRKASFMKSPIGRGGEGDHVERAPLVFDEISPSQSHRDGFSIQTSTCRPETQSLWSRQPFEQLFGASDCTGLSSRFQRDTLSNSRQSSLSGNSLSHGVNTELEVLETLQRCVGKLLLLDGAEWLFRKDNGADEDLIAAVAAMQKQLMSTEANDPTRFSVWEKSNGSHNHKGSNGLQLSGRQQEGVPNCGRGCVWERSLLVSFGVWCVHRVLELSLMESRPELWGKYTYVLNRLQGILEPAFSKPRVVPVPCRCLNDPTLLDSGRCRPSGRHASPRDYGSGDSGSSSAPNYPHPWPWGRNTTSANGKSVSASTFLDMIKEVETAVGSRKGRTGTTAGDVAFPKGKENLASVLKRYKRRLASKPPGSTSVASGGRRGSVGFPNAHYFAAVVS